MINRDKVLKVIGKGFADHLDAIVFSVGNMEYSRRGMIEDLGCGSLNAATRLQNVLNRLKINTPHRLFKLDPFSLARTRGIGEASMFVAMCILDANKYDVLKWWEFTEQDGKLVKFSTFKHHAMTRASKRKQEVA